MRKLGYEHPSTLRATQHPTTKDLYWASGLLEGEGCFSWLEAGTERVQCNMTDREPIEKLLALFGGRVSDNRYYPSRLLRGHKVLYSWTVTGSRARGVMMTLYALLSPRRQEAIRKCLTS